MRDFRRHHSSRVGGPRGSLEPRAMAIPRGDAEDPRDGSADAQSDDDASDTPEPSRFVTTALVSSSAVTHAVRGRFRAPDEVVVVLGKRDQLLLLAPDEENGGALRLERQQSARGTLVALKVARGGHRRSSPRDVREDDDRDSPPSDGVDLLVALSDSGELSLLRYDTETRRFARFRSARLGPPGMRRVFPGVAAPLAPLAEFDQLAVDPASGAIAASCADRACVFFGLDRKKSGTRDNDPGAPLRKEGRVVLGTAFAETPCDSFREDASGARGDRRPGPRFVALAVLARDREDEARILEARRRAAAARDAEEVGNGGDAAANRKEIEKEKENDAEEGAPLGADDAERDSARPRETREARRLREMREFGMGRDRPRRLRPPGMRLPMPRASAAAADDADAAAAAPRPDADRGTDASAGAAPTRLDVFYVSSSSGHSAECFAHARVLSVVFDDDTRAVLGERACLVDPRDDRGEAPLLSRGASRVRFLVLGEFGAVEVSAPSDAGHEDAENGELRSRICARVVARASPGETWAPRCHAWRAPRLQEERWSVAVAFRRDGDDDAFPGARAALAVDRETGSATPFVDFPDFPARADDGKNERKDVKAPSRRRFPAPTAMLPTMDGEAAIVFVADGSAAIRATHADRTRSERTDASSPVGERYRRYRYARDAVSLACASPSEALRGERPDRAPPLAPVDGFAPGARGDDSEHLVSFLLTAGGAPARVTFGVAASVTTVSPPGFGGVTSMWAPDEATLVLGFVDATRVFRVVTDASASASASASFVEAESGLGFELAEPTTACGAFRVNTRPGGMAQITSSRARLCAHGTLVSEWVPGAGDGVVGAAAVAPHGRAAVSLPLLGVVKVLAPMAVRDYHALETLQLLPVSIVRFANEPSCLCLPDPETGAAFLGAAKSDAITKEDVRAGAVTALVAGTYARQIVAVAARETRGSVATRAFASEVFRSELCILPEESSTAPAAMRVAFGDDPKKSDDGRAPALLVATRGGDLLVVEAGGAARRRRTSSATTTTTTATTPPTPKSRPFTTRRPTRLIGFGNGAMDLERDREPPVIRVGVDSAASAAEASRRSPLGDMFVSPRADARASPPSSSIRRPGDVAPDVDMTSNVLESDHLNEPKTKTKTKDAEKEKSGLRVVSARRLGNAPLAILEPLADAGAGAPVLVAGASGAWLARGVDGAQRVSVARVDAPPARALVAFGFGARRTRRSASALAAVGDVLKAVDVDADQADAAHRDGEPAFGALAGAPTKPEGIPIFPFARFVCRDPATGAAVAATGPHGAGGELDVAVWQSGGGAEEENIGEEEEHLDVGARGDDEDIVAEDVAAPARLPKEDAVAFDSPDGLAEGFRAVALASCQAEDGSSVLVVGARGVARGRARRALDGGGDAARVEGRVLFLRRRRDTNASETKTKHRFALAATAAFPDAVTCVSAAGPGLVLVGTTAGAHVLRVETRPFDGAFRGDKRVPLEKSRDAINNEFFGDGGLVGFGDATVADDAVAVVDETSVAESEDPGGSVVGTLRVWLAARLATRRPVLALAAGEPEFPRRGGVKAADEKPRASSERAMVEAMLFPGAREPERRRVVPVAVSVVRDGVSLCAYIAGGGFFETDKRRRLAPKAADPETRDAVAVALRRRGEVAGADARGRVFVLRRVRKSHARTGEVSRTPESNLRLAARFDLKGAKPVAVLMRDDRAKETPPTQKSAKKKNESVVAADRATLFDAAGARRGFGPSFAVATEEGGVFAVSEVSEEDWEVLARAQRLLDAHPATAPPLGAGVAKPSAGFLDEDGEFFAGASSSFAADGASKRYAALDAARRASAPSPPAVLDGTLLRELLDLPEKTQRSVLESDAESGAGTAEATLEVARRVLETDLF